jgi:hypothetical protein
VRTIESLITPLAVCSDDDMRDAGAAPAARALLAEILAQPRPRARRRALIPAVGLAVVAALAAIVVMTTTRGTARGSAAVVLHKAAAAALTEQTPGPGQYLYVHSTDVYLDTVAGATTYSALVPHERRVWFGPSGGRIVQTNGPPTFLSDLDRQRWIAAGRPDFGKTIDERVPPSAPLDLPADADALYDHLKAEAAGFGDRFYDEIFQRIGDALRETSATPAQRAALFTVAGRLPGIEVATDATDGAGRPAVAVSKDDEVSRIRYTLLLDPKTYVLVGEAQSVLAGNSFGYAPGTTIGSSTTLSSAIVDSTTS